jgi:DNA invertase Pin-like site-specific DNA recombinase
VSRSLRRSRLGGRRARRREAKETVLRILELSRQGYSEKTIAASVGVSEQHVTRVLFLVYELDHRPEKESVGEGVGGV